MTGRTRSLHNLIKIGENIREESAGFRFHGEGIGTTALAGRLIFRAFALEVDRGTEPQTSPQKRKSCLRSLQLYEEVIRTGQAAQHYGLTAQLLLLWVFTTKSGEERFWELVQRHVPYLQSRILTTVIAAEPEQITRRVPDLCAVLWRRGNEGVWLVR